MPDELIVERRVDTYGYLHGEWVRVRLGDTVAILPAAQFDRLDAAQVRSWLLCLRHR